MSELNESIIPDERVEQLSQQEFDHYSRNILLPEVGIEGQARIRAAKVLVIGTGGLGAPIALYLAAAGVGTIGLVDYDVVEESNLQRQIIHGIRDIGRPKTASARDSIKAINRGVQVVTHQQSLNSENALAILDDYDIIVDGTDNFPTRYLVNDAAVFLGKPLVYGSIYQFDGQVSVFDAKHGPCYRCVNPTPPPPELVPSCAEGGVLGVLPGLVGTLQATEVLKLIIGGAEPLIGRLLLVDAWSSHFDELTISKDPQCPVCGANPSITELIDYEEFCGLGPHEEAETPIVALSAHEPEARLESDEPLQLIDIREPHERALTPFPGARAVPYGQLVRRIGEFDPAVDLVFLCTIGQRSIFAIRALERAGYQGNLLNLRGGVAAWEQEFGQQQRAAG